MAKKGTVHTFVRGALPSVVWDPASDKTLAEFCDPVTKKVTGLFVTEDIIVAKKLKEMGYKEKKDYPEGAPVGGFQPAIPEPPDHITPGGPVPKKGEDIIVEKDETVTSVSKKKSKGIKKKTLLRRE